MKWEGSEGSSNIDDRRGQVFDPQMERAINAALRRRAYALGQAIPTNIPDEATDMAEAVIAHPLRGVLSDRAVIALVSIGEKMRLATGAKYNDLQKQSAYVIAFDLDAADGKEDDIVKRESVARKFSEYAKRMGVSYEVSFAQYVNKLPEKMTVEQLMIGFEKAMPTLRAAGLIGTAPQDVEVSAPETPVIEIPGMTIRGDKPSPKR